MERKKSAMNFKNYGIGARLFAAFGGVLFFLVVEIGARPLMGSIVWRAWNCAALRPGACRAALDVVAESIAPAELLSQETPLSRLLSNHLVQRSDERDVCVVTLRDPRGPAWFRPQIDGCPLRFYVVPGEALVQRVEALRGPPCYFY